MPLDIVQTLLVTAGAMCERRVGPAARSDRNRLGTRTFLRERAPDARAPDACMSDFLRILVAILLPPLGVFLQVGLRGAFWINILLTLLGYIPGIVHAVWVIARR